MHEMSLGPGEVLVNQMDTERVLFFIKEGSIDLVFLPFQKAKPSVISTINVKKMNFNLSFKEKSQFLD